MQDDINRLVARPAPEIRLDPADTPAAIREKTGLEARRAGLVNSNEVTVKSTDGLFTFTVRVVST